MPSEQLLSEIQPELRKESFLADQTVSILKKENMPLDDDEFGFDDEDQFGANNDDEDLDNMRLSEMMNKFQQSHGADFGDGFNDVELTDEAIENYFIALQQVAQNRKEIQQLDSITEYSGESDMSMALEQIPVNNKEDHELKQMIK